MIEVQNLVKRYGPHLAVDNLNFTIEKGQVYGLLGPNGAGKSTTMNIMSGYLGPTEGDVIINGKSITREPEAAKKYIGYLPEHPPLYMDMTVKEYLSFAAELKKIPKENREEEIVKAAEMTGVLEVSHRLIKNLSKGYQQRVGLAQAILGFPEIIILDEPTVGLDPKQIIEIRSLIRRLAQDHTVILSSHILTEVQEVCDTIMIIHKGKIAAAGSSAELEREMGNLGVLSLTIKGEEERAVSLLKQISGVSEVDVMEEEEPDTCALDLTLEEGADVREDVFRTCAAEDMPILMMKLSEVTLEDIFLELTSDQDILSVVEEEYPIEEEFQEKLEIDSRAEGDAKGEEVLSDDSSI